MDDSEDAVIYPIPPRKSLGVWYIEQPKPRKSNQLIPPILIAADYAQKRLEKLTNIMNADPSIAEAIYRKDKKKGAKLRDK